LPDIFEELRCIYAFLKFNCLFKYLVMIRVGRPGAWAGPS
jgi:hypothetical protein